MRLTGDSERVEQQIHTLSSKRDTIKSEVRIVYLLTADHCTSAATTALVTYSSIYTHGRFKHYKAILQ